MNNAQNSKLLRYSSKVIHWLFVGIMQLLGWIATFVLVHFLIDHFGSGTLIGSDSHIDNRFYVAVVNAGETEAITWQQYSSDRGHFRTKLWMPETPVNISGTGDFELSSDEGVVTLKMRPNDFSTISTYRIVNGDVEPIRFQLPPTHFLYSFVLSFLLFFTVGQWLIKHLWRRIRAPLIANRAS